MVLIQLAAEDLDDSQRIARMLVFAEILEIVHGHHAASVLHHRQIALSRKVETVDISL